MITTDINLEFARALGEDPAGDLRVERLGLRAQAQARYETLVKAAQARYETLVKAAQATTKGGRRKPAPVPEDALGAIRDQVLGGFPRLAELDREVKRVESEHQGWLTELAREYNFTPDPSAPDRVVRRAFLSNYSTQTAPGFYARAQLYPLECFLKARGYRARVEPGRGEDGNAHVLWANCTPVDAMAADRAMDDEERWGVFRGTAMNPYVLNPMLPRGLWP